MTTPNIEWIMPTTKLFTGTVGGPQWLTAADGTDLVYLPKGASLVQVTATGLENTQIRVNLEGRGFPRTVVADVTPEKATQRIYTDSVANSKYGGSGFWLKVWCREISAGQEVGTVAVTVTPLQVE